MSAALLIVLIYIMRYNELLRPKNFSLISSLPLKLFNFNFYNLEKLPLKIKNASYIFNTKARNNNKNFLFFDKIFLIFSNKDTQ